MEINVSVPHIMLYNYLGEAFDISLNPRAAPIAPVSFAFNTTTGVDFGYFDSTTSKVTMLLKPY